MSENCYWEKPLRGLDGKKEKKSKIYRDYYFENNASLTSQEVADHFNLSKEAIDRHRSNYQWDLVYSDKKRHDERKRNEVQDENYKEFVDQDAKNVKGLLTGQYLLVQLAMIKLELLPNTHNKEIPSWLTHKDALNIIEKTPMDKLHKMAIRDFEKPYVINDKQEHEMSGNLQIDTTVNLLERVKEKRKELNDLRSD